MVALLGGRRARIHADGTVETEKAPAPLPLRALHEVPTPDGNVWIGASDFALYRFADPLGPATSLFETDTRLTESSPVPGGVLIRQGRSSAVVDAGGGSRGGPFMVGAVPAAHAAFRSAQEGSAMISGIGTFETKDGGATWKPGMLYTEESLSVRYGFVVRGGEFRFERPKDLAPTIKWLLEEGTDPLADAAANGVPIHDAVEPSALIAHDTELAVVALDSGRIVSTESAQRRGSCAPFRRGDSYFAACADGSVYPLDVREGIRFGEGRPSGSEGKLHMSPDGGVAYTSACAKEEARGRCVRQPDGAFATIQLPKEFLTALPRPDGSLLLARKDAEAVVVERYTVSGSPSEVARWKGCANVDRVKIDESDAGLLIAGPVECPGDRPAVWGLYARKGGREHSETLGSVSHIRMAFGAVLAIVDGEVRYTSKPGGAWIRYAAADPETPSLSGVGFVAGGKVHLGLDPAAPATSAASAPAPPAARLALHCSTGPTAAPSQTGVEWRMIAGGIANGRLLSRSSDFGDVWTHLDVTKGTWTLRWWDTWELGRTVHELSTPPLFKSENRPDVGLAAARGAMYTAVIANHPLEDKLLRLVPGRKPEVEAAPKWGRTMALGEDGTTAWFEGSGDVLVWPVGKKPYSSRGVGSEFLPLAAHGGGAMVFAPLGAMDAVAQLDSSSPTGPIDISRLRPAVAGFDGKKNAVRGCSSAATGALARVDWHLPLVLDGKAVPWYQSVAEVRWESGAPPCFARFRGVTKGDLDIVRVDFGQQRADHVALLTGEVKSLSCELKVQ